MKPKTIQELAEKMTKENYKPSTQEISDLIDKYRNSQNEESNAKQLTKRRGRRK